MLSNGLHGQRYHSLTVFVPTIKCPHYCQLAQHLYPERHHEHMGCHQGHRESCLERRESCLERRDRQRERESCLERRERESTGGAVTSGCLPRVYDWCFVRLVRVGWLRRPLQRVFYGWCLVRAGQGGLVRACCLRLVGIRLLVTVGWLGYAVYGWSVTPCGDRGLVRAGWLGLAVYGWLVTPCGDSGLVRVCCLWLVGYDWWLGWAVYGGLVTADVCVKLGCRDGTCDLA